MLSASYEEYKTADLSNALKLFDILIHNFASDLSPNKGTPQ
jgi:hypothetical protein